MEVSSIEPIAVSVEPQIVEVYRFDSSHISVFDQIYRQFIKRSIDIFGALVLLLVLSPVFLIVTLLILRDSPGSVIFRQTRMGRNQTPFACYKFRSMVAEAEAILQRDHQLRLIHSTNWKLSNDPRVTRLGRLLRKTSIDELPQLINVLKGDMSLIGPRPYMPIELGNEFARHCATITSVRPGMTGLWQVSGRALLSPHQRVELDTEYAPNCSLALDFRIAVKTVAVVVRGVGAS